jgi:hypothetical protein
MYHRDIVSLRSIVAKLEAWQNRPSVQATAKVPHSIINIAKSDLRLALRKIDWTIGAPS